MTTQTTDTETYTQFVARVGITADVTRMRFPLTCDRYHKHTWMPCPTCKNKAVGPTTKGTDWKDTANEWSVTFRRGGRTMTVPYWTGSAIKETPTAANVLQSLASDAQMGREPFEEFCGNLGLDTDSRKALQLYLDCQSTGNELFRLIGNGKDFDTLLSGLEE